MKLNYRSEKGITMIAIVITVIILLIIVSTVSFSSKNGIDLKNINNMHADIMLLEDKVAMYYLRNKALPIKGAPIIESEIPDEIKNANPNDKYKEFITDTDYKWHNYYIIDLTLLDNLDLNNAKDVANVKDVYIINEGSHAIYYLKGIKVNEYDNTAVERKIEKTYYTIPREYSQVDLDVIEAELGGAYAVYTNPNYFTYDPIEPSIITGFNTAVVPVKNHKFKDTDAEGNELVFTIPYERTIVEANGIVKKVAITKIEDGAFRVDDSNDIKIDGDISIPNRIIIGDEAFKGQDLIKNADLNLNGIGIGAFENCNGLETLSIRGLKVITEGAFKGAFRNPSNSKTIIIGEPVREVEGEAFAGIGEIKTLKFPSSLERIKDNAFAYPEAEKGLKTLDFSNCHKLTEIGEYAFYNHKKINNITFSTQLVKSMTIEKLAFNNLSVIGEYIVILNDYIEYYVNSFPAGVKVEEGKLIE